MDLDTGKCLSIYALPQSFRIFHQLLCHQPFCHLPLLVTHFSPHHNTHSDSEPSLPRTLLSPSFQTKQNHAQTPPENIRESSLVSGEDVKAYILWLIINNACS